MGINIDLEKTQKYIDWLREKIYLDSIAGKASKRRLHRGQVYKCKLGMGIGSEETKERPCVILQYNGANNSSPNTIVAPITHAQSSLTVVVPIEDKFDNNGELILDGNVLLGNIVCISKARLGDYIAQLSNDEMKNIDKAIAISIGLYHYYETSNNKYNDKQVYISKLQNKIKALEEKLEKNEINPN